VLTKRMAEDLTEYLHERGIRVRYMHSDIDTLERIEIIRDLRLGAFDVLIGINLLREGLDIPECGFVAILDADKEGFLRSETSLIQTIGRAARNVDGKVILYADQHHRQHGAGDGGDQAPPREAARIQRRPRHHARDDQANIGDIRQARHPQDPASARCSANGVGGNGEPVEPRDCFAHKAGHALHSPARRVGRPCQLLQRRAAGTRSGTAAGSGADPDTCPGAAATTRQQRLARLASGAGGLELPAGRAGDDRVVRPARRSAGALAPLRPGDAAGSDRPAR
jgi:hypothetical protein